MRYAPTNSANKALGNLYFFDESSLMPNVYLNPAISINKKKCETNYQ